MTLRAVLIGLLGALSIAGFEFLCGGNSNNYIPIGVFGMLILVGIAVNPLLFLLRAKWQLRSVELALALALILVACSIPGNSLLSPLVPALAHPIQASQTSPGLRSQNLLGYVPPAMLPADGRYDEEVIGRLIFGAREGGQSIGLGDVPWGKWKKPLITWTTIIVLVAVGSLALGLVVHRQWSAHERLRYPIAIFAESIIDEQPGRAFGPVFRSRGFWIGLGVVLLIRLLNGIHAFYPESIDIPLGFDFTALRRAWPTIDRIPGIGWLLEPRVFPTVVGFTYFLASDISFSLGIGPAVFAIAAAVLLTRGVDISNDWIAGGPLGWQLFGSYLGLAAICAYVGRRFYWDVLKHALTGMGSAARRNVWGPAVWGCRVFLLSCAAIVAVLVTLGLQWPVAILLVAIMMMQFMVFARITAESGLFYMHSYWMPTAALAGLFGIDVLGPKAIIISGIISIIFCVDPRTVLMPFFVNGLKICDRFNMRPGRLTWSAAGTFVLCLAVALPVVMWANYNFGIKPGWAGLVAGPYKAAERTSSTLALSGDLGTVNELSAWDRLAQMRPRRKFLWATGIGLALVFGFSAMRLRFTWWPLHPIMFLVWCTWQMGVFAFSFLLGWLIKSLVTRLWGGVRYQQLKPLMIGVAAGDLLGGFTFWLVGVIDYAITGLAPRVFSIYV